MNLMLLLAQVAPALADSVAGANPVLTLRSVLLYSVRAQLRYP